MRRHFLNTLLLCCARRTGHLRREFTRPSAGVLNAIAILLVIGGTAVADTRLTMEEISIVSFPESEPTETRTEFTLWLREDRAARVAPGMRMIARIDLGEVYLIDDARQTVTTIALGGLPEALATAPQIEKTGETREIGAWNAERYDMTLATGELNDTIVLWISDDLDIEMDAYRAYSRSLDGGTGMMSSIAELPGYPVLQEADLGIVKSTTRLLSVAEETPPAGTYDVPTNYERK